MTFGTSWNPRAKDAALVPVRVALGSTMLYHGYEKLRGEGPRQTGEAFEGLGIRPGKAWAVATGAAELFAGAAAVLGIATRPAAVAVLVTQGMAVAKVHGPKGYSNLQGGMEYNLALMAIAAALLLGGPGRVSAHEALEHAIDGRGPRRLWRRARPTVLSRAVRLLG
ncbi:MAG TPA: DoxX family protein [Anaeromyxobacteraceae bacterium]